MILTQTDRNQEVVLQTVSGSLIPQVIQLHRAVFQPDLVACTIYACQGVDRYLANLIAYPQFQQEHVWWGAWKGNDLAGYAHFRALPDSWHLNNIAVLPSSQGQGIGRLLWSRFYETARQRRFQRVTLDVESDNQPAIDWYHRQGLQVTSAVWRYEKRINPDVHLAETQLCPRLVGWEQAEAWQSLYGFSHFQIQSEDQIWSIGRIGERYFTMSQPPPAEIGSALSQIDSSRYLLILSTEPLSEPGFRMLGKSLRMSGELP